MREILFRGKQKNTGKWVEGAYCKHDTVKVCFTTDDPKTRHLIIRDGFCDWGFEPPLEGVEVDPTTIGQYTGLKDKNGKRIFEGDAFCLDDELIAAVTFKDGCFRLKVYGMCGTYTESGYDECGGGWGVVECDPIDWYYVGDMQIAGNIHDNPELLEG